MRSYAPLVLPDDIHRLIDAAKQRGSFVPLPETEVGKDDSIGLPGNVIPFRRVGRRS